MSLSSSAAVASAPNAKFKSWLQDKDLREKAIQVSE